MDVANIFIEEHGSELTLTNLVLNKLVYYTQVTSLRVDGKPLFSDPIEAWGMGLWNVMCIRLMGGIVSASISELSEHAPENDAASDIVSSVVANYGFLSAFDLVTFSHRPGGAWKTAYQPNKDVVITNDMILASRDGIDLPDRTRTLASGIDAVNRDYPNTFRILKNA